MASLPFAVRLSLPHLLGCCWPASQASGESHTYAYYDFELPALGDPIEVTLTALSGDPDAYGSFTTRHPTDVNYDAGMMSASTEDIDSFTVVPGSADYPTELPAVLHVAVHAYTATSYTIMVQRAGAEEPGEVLLLPGQPQTGNLRNGNHKFYKFHAGNTSVPFAFALEPLGTGDPDLYISTRGMPYESSCDGELQCWESNSATGDEVIVGPDDPNYCNGCTYHIMVYAASNVHYTLSARLLGSYGTINTLQEGVPIRGVVPHLEYRFYQLDVGALNASVVLTLTPFSGDADM